MKPFDEMKSREVAAFNHNHCETEKMLTEIRDKLHSENRPDSIQGLQEIQNLITEYVSILRDIDTTIHEHTHFEENQSIIDRNKEYNRDAIKTLETSLQVVKDRIKKRETEQLNLLPKTFITGLPDETLKKLRKSLIDNNFICNSIKENEFIYIFSCKPITKEMKPIKWKLHRGLSALREFIFLLTGETVHKNQVRHCFIDKNDKPCEILKPKKDEYSQHYKKLEEIITGIKR
jgi:hypothetical protein